MVPTIEPSSPESAKRSGLELVLLVLLLDLVHVLELIFINVEASEGARDVTHVDLVIADKNRAVLLVLFHMRILTLRDLIEVRGEEEWFLQVVMINFILIFDVPDDNVDLFVIASVNGDDDLFWDAATRDLMDRLVISYTEVQDLWDHFAGLLTHHFINFKCESFGFSPVN